MTKLLKELLQITEDKQDVHKKNLEAIGTALQFDGTIELGQKTHNQADKLGADNKGNTLWYVSLNPPTGDCEAYVIISKSGKLSYYDHTHHTLVFNDEIVNMNTPRGAIDQLDDIVDEHKFESNSVNGDGIQAYIDWLKDVADSY